LLHNLDSLSERKCEFCSTSKGLKYGSYAEAQSCRQKKEPHATQLSSNGNCSSAGDFKKNLYLVGNRAIKKTSLHCCREKENYVQQKSRKKPTLS
jgi:hypothetical protein